jgi:diguanylate cyclase (GGDEF)-like protein/PAS domain S-box-containing protein
MTVRTKLSASNIQEPNMTVNLSSQASRRTRHTYRTWIVFALLMLMVPLSAVTIIQNHAPQMRANALNNLTAIAELKAHQLSHWLTEQERVVSTLAANRALTQHVQTLLRDPTHSDSQDEIINLIATLLQLYGYESIALYTPQGTPLLPDTPLYPLTNSQLQALWQHSLATQKPQRSDLINTSDTPHLDFIVPLLNTSSAQQPVVALMVLQIRVADFILPYLTKWPSASPSAELLLIRPLSERIEWLSSPTQTDLEVQQTPFDQAGILGSNALQTRQPGVLEGLDHRGVAVLAAYHPVNHSDWVVMAKVDQQESDQSLNELIVWTSLISLLAAISLGLLFFILFKKQRRTLEQQHLNEKQAAQQLLQHFYELPFIGMAIVDRNQQDWLHFNPHLAHMLGYAEQALSTTRLREVIAPEDRPTLENRLAQILAAHSDGVKLECHLLKQDSSKLDCVLDIKCVRTEQGDIEYFLITFEDITDLIWLKDPNGVFLSCNPSFERFMGASEAEIVGKTDYDFFDAEQAEFFRKNDLRAMHENRPCENEEQLSFADHSYSGLFSTIKTPMRDASGQVIGILGIARDITQRKAAEKQLERLTLLYSAMSKTNEAIVRSDNQQELFAQICHIAVQDGGMQLAWVGLLDDDTGLVKPVAHFGEHSDYLQGLTISTDADQPTGQGPTGIAMRENRPYWCQHFLNEPRTAAWHERAKEAGWRSSAALPLRRHGKVIGAFNIYSSVENAFDEAAQSLLLEMTTDIGFALNEFANERERLQVEAEREEALNRLQKLAAHLPGVIYQYRLMPDGHSFFPFASNALYDIFHVTPEQVVNDATPIFNQVHPEDLGDVKASIQASADTLKVWQQEFRICHQDGEIRWLASNAMPQRESDGSVLWHGFTHDVTERKQSESQLQLASKVFEQSQEGIMITDAEQKILLVNQAFTQISGYSAEEVLGKNPKILASGKHGKAFYQHLWRTLHQHGFWQGEIWNRRKNGEIFPEWLSISRGLNAAGQITEYVAMFTDISAMKASEEKIQQLAHFDPLTGLANRQLLMDRLQQAIQTAQRHHTPLALLFIDLDHFKNVNDTLGHHVGDELLVKTARRMQGQLRAEDTLSRQGGDEFIVVLPGTDDNGAAHVAQKMVDAVSSELKLGRYDLVITPSIGIAVYPQDGDDTNSLLKNADAAMYQAKRDGRNTYRFFTAEMQAHASRLMQIESALRNALQRNELSLHYQPQIDARSHRVFGVEALIRWQHPQLGAISPVEFIPVAEHSGQILQLGEWILRTALQQHKAWLAQGLPPLTMAVNLSAVQFRHQELPNVIIRMLAEEGIDPGYLELELTESVAMSDPESAMTMIDKLNRHGIQIAIDDFGTGYSSLSYLKRFNASKLKIDQSFVRDLTVDTEDLAIVEAIISLAQSLNLKTIAEGVETAEQQDLLLQRGCDEFQGYLFSRPLPAAEIADFIRQQNA